MKKDWKQLQREATAKLIAFRAGDGLNDALLDGATELIVQALAAEDAAGGQNKAA